MREMLEPLQQDINVMGKFTRPADLRNGGKDSMRLKKNRCKELKKPCITQVLHSRSHESTKTTGGFEIELVLAAFMLFLSPVCWTLVNLLPENGTQCLCSVPYTLRSVLILR